MAQIEALISDSDGTLLDTVSLIQHGQYETARQYLVEHGIPDEEIPTYETYDELLTKTVGGSAKDTLERTVRLLYKASPHHLESMDFDKLHDMLNPVQDRIAKEHIIGIRGALGFLAQLRRGWHWSRNIYKRYSTSYRPKLWSSVARVRHGKCPSR